MKINTALESAWGKHHPLLMLLVPLSWLFAVIVTVRRKLYDWGIFKRQSFKTPVIVVGNILLGGTGKTPFVIALVEYLQSKNLKVGVVSRGYKAQCKTFPYTLTGEEGAAYAGDEPSLIREVTQAQVVIDPDRPRGIQCMIDEHAPDVIVCDDGLQHYALKPGFSIVLHPKDREFYPHCLPAGPLREPLSRLNHFDLLINDLSLEVAPLDASPSWRYTLVTGIAHPERVAQLVAGLGIDADLKSFPDHHDFSHEDFKSISGPIIMTEKDEVKCKHLMLSQPVYVLRIKAKLSDRVEQAINTYLGIAP